MHQELHNVQCYVEGKLLGTVDVQFNLKFDVSALRALFEPKSPTPILCAIVYRFSKS